MRRALALVSLVFATAAFGQPKTAAAPASPFVPAGSVVVQEVRGDLNKDGRPDRVLMIKGTDPKRFVDDPQRGRLDRNRRGLVIVFDDADGPKLALVHRDCFSSENEDGGVYFAPELDLSIQKGVLRVAYGHGRYGNWSYDFRHQGGEFVLIGHDSSENRGPVVQRTTSVNLLSRKARTQVNVNAHDEDAPERFKERWTSFTLDTPIRLKDIADFDEFDVMGAIGLKR